MTYVYTKCTCVCVGGGVCVVMCMQCCIKNIIIIVHTSKGIDHFAITVQYT